MKRLSHPRIFWERSMLSVRNEAWLRHPTSSILSSGVCMCMCVFFLFTPTSFLKLSPIPHTLPQRISSREQLVPHIGCFPQTQRAFTGNQWLLIFPCTVVLCVDWHGLNYTDLFCRAISIQMCLFTNSGN